MSTTDADESMANEKPVSKRQLKMQKRQEEWLMRKTERRLCISIFHFLFVWIFKHWMFILLLFAKRQIGRKTDK